MKLSSLLLACLAVIVHGTSGELIPGRIQTPRIKRESVYNVRSPNPLDHDRSGIQRLPARYVRQARPSNAPLYELTAPSGGSDITAPNVPGLTSPISGGSEITAPNLPGLTSPDALTGAAPAQIPSGGSNILAPNVPGLTSQRSRRRAESLSGIRPTSQTPSGPARQPIRRSAAPRNLAGP